MTWQEPAALKRLARWNSAECQSAHGVAPGANGTTPTIYPYEDRKRIPPTLTVEDECNEGRMKATNIWHTANEVIVVKQLKLV